MIRVSTAKIYTDINFGDEYVCRYMQKETFIFSDDVNIRTRYYIHGGKNISDEYCIRFHDKLVYGLNRIVKRNVRKK
jgi:hypothetical protein